MLATPIRVDDNDGRTVVIEPTLGAAAPENAVLVVDNLGRVDVIGPVAGVTVPWTTVARVVSFGRTFDTVAVPRPPAIADCNSFGRVEVMVPVTGRRLVTRVVSFGRTAEIVAVFGPTTAVLPETSDGRTDVIASTRGTSNVSFLNASR